MPCLQQNHPETSQTAIPFAMNIADTAKLALAAPPPLPPGRAPSPHVIFSGTSWELGFESGVNFV